MSGIQLRLKKLFKGKKNLVISALDHVLAYGTQKGIENAEVAIKNCITTDGLLLPRFMLKRNWDLFSTSGTAVPIVRINWSTSFYYPLDYREGNTAVVTTVEEAVEAGAEGVICSLFIEEENQARERDNIAIFAEIVKQKETLGIPLIGEAYVVEHRDKTEDEVHGKVKRVSRIMEELGADLIKTFYTGDKFHEVVENVSIPVFTIGAEKLNTDLEVLQKAFNSIQQGARGIIFGRNIFMSQDPIATVKALNEVINNNMTPKDAEERHLL